MHISFIQFYSNSLYLKDHKYTILHNGFSDIYEIGKGKFTWAKTDDKIELSFEKGKVYVSCFFANHLYEIYRTALRYPKVDFIVGGPALWGLKTLGKLPKNLTIYYGSLESYFNGKHKWNLDIPVNTEEIYFTYSIRNYCTWGKCRYCIHSCPPEECWQRSNYDFEFQHLPGKHRVRLGISDITKNDLRFISNLPTYDKLVSYFASLRFDYKTISRLNMIKQIKTLPPISLAAGLEFPTQHMWNYMKKGYTSSEVLKSLNLLNNMEIPLTLGMITGWNCLTETDLFELELFMSKLPIFKSLTIFLYKLFIFNNSSLYHEYEPRKESTFGPFNYGFMPKLSQKQIELNKKAEEIIIHSGKEKNIKFHRFGDNWDNIINLPKPEKI